MSLLTHAMRDCGSARELYNNKVKRDNEDIYINDVCYHEQQCIEKCLKYLVELSGNKYEWTHEIYSLCEDVLKYYENDMTVKSFVSEVIDMANTYTSWESRSRYEDGFKETINNIEKGFRHCEGLIEICKTIEAM